MSWKNNFYILIAILGIFFTYTVLRPVIILDGVFSAENKVIPFLWSILFVYLYGKKYTLIVINSYLIFLLMLLAEKLNFGELSFSAVMTYTILTMGITFLFVFIYQELYILKKFKIAFILSCGIAFALYLVPMSFIMYYFNYGTSIAKDILYAVLQTNSAEAIEQISEFMAIQWIVLFVLITAVIGFFLFKQEKKETSEIERSLLIFIIIIFLTISLSQVSELRLPKFILEGYESYHKELNLFSKMQEQRKDIKIAILKPNENNTSESSTGKIYIVIIGESLNKRHMGIYNYFRNTTPNLSKMKESKELLVFKNVYSNHVHTDLVLSLSLTEANQINGKPFYQSISIIDILNQSDIETYWITSQTLGTDAVSTIARSSDHLILANETVEADRNSFSKIYDELLIEEVKKALAEKTDKNKVIFVHLMGSHTDYGSRYPKTKYSSFKGALKQEEFGQFADSTQIMNMQELGRKILDIRNLSDIKALIKIFLGSTQKRINNYDNSIVYNDYVVSSILHILQQQKGGMGLIYMSDHSEDVFRQLGHNSGNFTYEMTQIPMLAWFSDQYIERYTNKYTYLARNRNTLFSNDFLYDTLVGIFDINTSNYNSHYDLSSEHYQLDDEDAFTLHRKKHYTDASNYIWWQRKNVQFLIDSNQSSRVFPGEVNSIGKLKDIWFDGIKSFEVDVLFVENNTSCFKVGSNEEVISGSLEKLLSSIEYTKIQRLLLDLKNLNKNNYNQVIKRLNYLDNKFNIIKNITIESSTTFEYFRFLKEEGWNTSYYLPTNEILKVLKKDNSEEIKQLAIEIAAQSKIQNLSEISFDDNLYPFVKQYLEPLIADDIVYHIWYALDMHKNTFQDELLKNDLYFDERVEATTVIYKSDFDL